MRRRSVVLFLAFFLVFEHPLIAQQAISASVRITAAFVSPDLTVKPIPLHQLRLFRDGSRDTLITQTRLDGSVEQEIAAGAWTLESVRPLELGGLRYSWHVSLSAASGQSLVVELTNDNAAVDSSQSQQPPEGLRRFVGPEVTLFQRLRAGVFRIEAGLSSGTGFLVDTNGLVLTNSHVIAGSAVATAMLDSMTHVQAVILYRDENVDLAVLKVSPDLVRGRPTLPLAIAVPNLPLVEPGERLIALGFPLHQEQTMTSGIASSVREGAIISDVNINHGNSGGPLLNLAGEVVGINTFGDFSNDGGPGISGSVVVSRAIPVLEAAKLAMGMQAEPGTELLPIVPPERFSTSQLKALADTADVQQYERLWDIGVGNFRIGLATPPINYVHAKAYENEVGKDRKAREARAGLSEDERYSELRDYRDWMEYVGDIRAAVITITVEPKMGETTGSLFRRLMLTGTYGKQTVRYKGDLREAEIYRNGERVTPIRGGTTPVKQYVDNVWVDLKDVASYGYYVLPASILAPDLAGTLPVIQIKLIDLKNPDLPSCARLKTDVVAAAWSDFAALYSDLGRPVPTANRKAFPPKVPEPPGCNPGM